MQLTWTAVDSPRSLRRTLGAHRHGRGDPTTRIEPGRFLRATLTPDGPGTLLLRWTADPAPARDAGLAAVGFVAGLQSNFGKAEILNSGSVYFNNPAHYRTNYAKLRSVSAADRPSSGPVTLLLRLRPAVSIGSADLLDGRIEERVGRTSGGRRSPSGGGALGIPAGRD